MGMLLHKSLLFFSCLYNSVSRSESESTGQSSHVLILPQLCDETVWYCLGQLGSFWVQILGKVTWSLSASVPSIVREVMVSIPQALCSLSIKTCKVC